MNEKFLFELLNINSPSGSEVSIQRRWLDYITPFADEVRTDNAGNVIAVLNPESKFKILLSSHCDEVGLIIKYIDEKGFLYFEKLGGINLKTLIGVHIEVITSDSKFPGVIGVNAPHLSCSKNDVKVQDLNIDCGFSSKREAEENVKIGDLVVHQVTTNVLMERYITGKALDNKSSLFVISEVFRLLSEQGCTVGVYAASTVNEETNMSGAYYAAEAINPSIALACDVTFATDFPNISHKQHGLVSLGRGPVLSKGSPINNKLNFLLEKSASKLNLSLQYDLTPTHTWTDADKIQFTGRGVPIALVSLPLRYMHSPVEVISRKDLKSEIELLFTMVNSLTGDEKFNPI